MCTPRAGRTAGWSRLVELAHLVAPHAGGVYDRTRPDLERAAVELVRAHDGLHLATRLLDPCGGAVVRDDGTVP